MAEKKYYWLKLYENFFRSKEMKKLRSMAGGDTYTIIYLKMQLLAIKTDCILTWSGIEDSFEAEIALELDEKVDDVRMTILYLQSKGLIEMVSNEEMFLPEAVKNTGNETATAGRMRKYRARLKENAELGNCNNVTPLLQACYTEIEKEKDKDKDPPISPKGDSKEIEIWDEKAFERFWKLYPKKKDKVKAIKEWNKLKADRELMEEMAAALRQQIASEEWQRDDGRAIPYPCRWISHRRWEDVIQVDLPEQKAAAAWEESVWL